MKIAAIILTKNERARIFDCLMHLRPYVDYILVLDGKSTDGTAELADTVAETVISRDFSGSFADEKNYARTQVPPDHSWILWVDADERFDRGFLETMHERIALGEDLEIPVFGFRFPRVNLPDSKDWPDYQLRLIKNSRDIGWRGAVHEIPVYIPEDIPLDQMDQKERQKGFGISTQDDFSILHLPRRTDEKRSWW
ncbi:hypothetical protein ES703_119864 [subsurface metagenome]